MEPNAADTLKNNNMFASIFKTAIRALLKNKTYSFINITGLATGIACAGLIFLWAENEVNWDNNNFHKNTLYQVQVNIGFAGNNFTMGSTPRPMAAAIKAEIPGVINTARCSDQGERLLVNVSDKSLYVTGRYTDAALFSMFTFTVLQGNPANPFPQLYSLVISQSTAKRLFGNETNIVGKTVKVNNKRDYVISGVVKDMPENATLQFEYLAPYKIVSSELLAEKAVNDETDWRSYGPLTYVQLDNNANTTVINNQLKHFIHRKAAVETSEVFIYPMKYWHLYDEFAGGKPTGGGHIKQVQMLLSIAWIILLIACINFMNLATASSQKRAKEVGVRKVLGAERKRLVIQFMGEAFFMSLIATIFAVAIMFIALPAFNMLMQKQLSLNLTSKLHILSLLAIAVICGFIAGSYPSLYLSSFNPVFILKGLKIKTGNASLIRKGLVVTQFAVSVVFIISTIIVYTQIQHIKNRELGFNKNNLVEINPENDISKTFAIFKNDLVRTGIIENVALADHSTLTGGDTDAGFTWPGKAPGNDVAVAHRNVSPEFVATSGMKVLRGRDFNSNALSETSNVIINESMEKMMGMGSAIGKTIQSPRGNPDRLLSNMTVIGVVSDYVYGNVYDGSAGPVIIFCKQPEFQNFLYVRIKATYSTENALKKIGEIMKKDNPAYPLEYKFVDEQFAEMFKSETLISKVSGVFAVLAIFISCLGLFGLAAYTAEQRTKEIGVRKVLGANVTEITAMLSTDFLKLVAIACAIAFPVAWWLMHNWLLAYEYRITISWWIFLAAGFSALFIALITISFQSIKAALANPVKSLRTE